mgnify:CR=1 FL=1
MSEHAQKVIKVGGIISADLTIPNTEQVLDFYQQVIGWQSEGLAMEDEQGKYGVGRQGLEGRFWG